MSALVLVSGNRPIDGFKAVRVTRLVRDSRRGDIIISDCYIIRAACRQERFLWSSLLVIRRSSSKYIFVADTPFHFYSFLLIFVNLWAISTFSVADYGACCGLWQMTFVADMDVADVVCGRTFPYMKYADLTGIGNRILIILLMTLLYT